ncbi:SDR family oxidoreductase [Ornithinimicrobium sp. F0845]|uniref:SDR family oxidoreductase n=1 Tax=Ornithinimicrobium sp. F0845 TaxID=2926412 RepID=UPI001FF1F177|nr:SDR family oxidoreductase [Ornithinimicrobium sp. F0845]MCK0112319.1 SDR family oxidoreductase [Ornithinimicrobium sp. F0845]
MRIAVTGATGHLGGLVIQFLLERGVAPGDVTAIVRDEAKAAGLAAQGIRVAVAPYEDATALTAALDGVDRLVLVSGSEVGQRLAQHTNIINAAKAAGVQFIAYTSLLNLDTSELGLAPEHRGTEEFLAQSGIDHALLRNGWYWENYASAIDSGRATGKFFGAAGSARVSGAARRDYAEAAAVVVTGENHAGKVYELAGSPSLDYPGIADEVAKVIGTDVTYVNQSAGEYQATLESFGMPAEVATMFAQMDPVIEQGALYSESTDLQDLIARPSTPAAQALSA